MAIDHTFCSKYGPRALIAGAAVGLGAEYARQIAARGLDVVLLDRDDAALRATGEEIREHYEVGTQTLSVDLARPDLIEALRAADADRDIGLLVYNAAIGTVAPFLDLHPAHWETMIDVNCRGPVRLAHTLLGPMVARQRGGLILMSSLSGNFGSAQLAIYAATKAFNLVLADALWVELRSHGVDVLAVQPGSTRTPGFLSSQPDGKEMMPVMEPTDVVREALATLGAEPCIVPGEANRQVAAALAQLPRRQVIELMSEITGKLVRNDRPADRR
ncbi:MAG TPA: SDR family NAD(P)-dependent oxidoreductase [Candidatus Binatia bacterium]|nr:SDR family NAD(P)-dependent oxidoreductase [Candidatus Binatia bacterium]